MTLVQLSKKQTRNISTHLRINTLLLSIELVSTFRANSTHAGPAKLRTEPLQEMFERHSTNSGPETYFFHLAKLGNIAIDANINVSQLSHAENTCCGNKFCFTKTKSVSASSQKHFASRRQILLSKHTLPSLATMEAMLTSFFYHYYYYVHV